MDPSSEPTDRKIAWEGREFVGPFRVVVFDAPGIRSHYLEDANGEKFPMFSSEGASFLCSLLNNAAAHHGVFMAGVLAERARIARMLAAQADVLEKAEVGIDRRSRIAYARELAEALEKP